MQKFKLVKNNKLIKINKNKTNILAIFKYIVEKSIFLIKYNKNIAKIIVIIIENLNI